MRTTVVFTTLASLTLSACSSAIPASRDATDLANAQTEFDRVLLLDNIADRPIGPASYTGEIGSELIIDGDPGGAFIGSLTLDVNFDSNDVTGEISDITLYDDGEPDQNLGGALDVTGTFVDDLNAAASGSLSAVEESGPLGLSGSADLNLTLTGRLADDAGTDTMVGNVTGGGSGDFEVFLQGDNGFYAR